MFFHCALKLALPSAVIKSTVNTGGSAGATTGSGAGCAAGAAGACAEAMVEFRGQTKSAAQAASIAKAYLRISPIFHTAPETAIKIKDQEEQRAVSINLLDYDLIEICGECGQFFFYAICAPVVST